MAQVFISADGSQVIPGATAAFKVQTSAQGRPSAGVIMLVGEADAGPDYTLESDLQPQRLRPRPGSAPSAAKYKSGPLVDAVRGDRGQPLERRRRSRAPSAAYILVKTNPSTKASANLVKRDDVDAYGTLYDQSRTASSGNNIFRGPSPRRRPRRSPPTTGSFTWIPPVGTVNADLARLGRCRPRR
jgi:hypothetical protein